MAYMHSVAEKMRLSEPPYYQRQKCRRLVSEDIRFMRIIVGFIERGQTTVWLATTAIFSVFAGYFFGNFRDKASVII